MPAKTGGGAATESTMCNEMLPPPSMNNAVQDFMQLPPMRPPRLIRQIRDEYWIGGRTYLEERPRLQEVCVYTYEYTPGLRWEFWVLRGANGTYVQRTMYNGQIEAEGPMPF